MWIKRHSQTGRRQRAPSRKGSMEWAVAGGGRRAWWRPTRMTEDDKFTLWTYWGDRCVVTPHVHLGVWGWALLQGADTRWEGRATSIYLRDWNLAPRQVQISGEETTCCELCSITASLKLSLLWHQACWKGFVYNCVKLSQETNLCRFRPIYGFIFSCIRVEGHWLRRCNGEGCREAPLGDTLSVPSW